MTEYDLFVECIPMIAEMADLARMMDRQEYEAWKRGIMEDMAPEPEAAKVMGRFLAVVDALVLEETVNN